VEPWLAKLNAGDLVASWDLFIGRYRALIVHTITRLIDDRDETMDVFSAVCHAFTANDFARLRRYDVAAARGASVATWIATVVRNLTVDWLRKRDGRRSTSVPSGLTPLQQQIFTAICVDGASHVEAYEQLRVALPAAVSFGEFLREVTVVHRQAPCPGTPRTARPAAPVPEPSVLPPDSARLAELGQWLGDALASEPADVRLAIKLLVIDRVPAAEIARIVHWPNAKAVYNRVYRALAAGRAWLEARGLTRDHF
jgi:RNA polymerase sigma factor (sigma-70 family)